jgi:hypothetical protein
VHWDRVEFDLGMKGELLSAKKLFQIGIDRKP